MMMKSGEIVVVLVITLMLCITHQTLAFITTPSVSSVSSVVQTQSKNVAFVNTKNNNRLIQKQNEYILDSTSVIVGTGRSSTGSSVQTFGLFGLGGPEIAVILVAAAFLLGPQKLAEFGRDAGKIAGELKEVPKEFQAGIAEGEREAAKIKSENEVMVSPAKKEPVDAEKTD